MTEQEFEAKTGRKPQMDDVDRVNCESAGLLGHWHCGWCEQCDKPRFDCLVWRHTEENIRRKGGRS